MIEYRIKRFQELHNNKWFHIMNYNIDMLLLKIHKKEAYILGKYGSCFYY
jgi:hypothetical protein